MNKLQYATETAALAAEEILVLRAQIEQLKHYIIALTHADETGYVDDIGFVENFSEIQDEVAAIVAEVRAQAVEDSANQLASMITAPPGMHSSAVIKLNLIASQLRQQAKVGEE